MAYGNWGAFVFRNGERMRAWEDNTPFLETSREAGYHQAFGIANLTAAMTAQATGETIPADALLDRANDLGPHHASLGGSNVRLCGYKAAPRLYVNGERVDLAPFVTETYDSWTGADGVTHHDGSEWEGAIEGHRFRAEFDTYTLNTVDLLLVEPDGTVWRAACGYCIGAGWQEDAEAHEPAIDLPAP